MIQPFTKGMRGGKVLQVGNKTSPSWIVRYIMGRDDGSAAPRANFPVDRTHLKFLENWLKRKLGSATLSLKGA